MAILSEWLTQLEMLPALSQPREIRVAPRVMREGLKKWSCQVVTITGTNGKGSTATLLSAILQAQGLRVGCYTSPHLLEFRERLLIQGEMCTETAWVTALEWVQAGQLPGEIYSFFDWITLAALSMCQQSQLDVLILEVGVGGRFDAVNAVDADVSVITSVALDHTAWLGADREAIGAEKVAIARSGCPLIYGEPCAPHTVRASARAMGAVWYGLDDQFGWRDGYWFADSIMVDPLGQIPFSSYAFHPHNVATAIMAAWCCHADLTSDTILQGIKSAVLPGRLEYVKHPFPIIWDVAHNPAAMQYSATVLLSREKPRRRRALFSMLNDKLVQAGVEALLPVVDEWHIFSLAAGTARALSVIQLSAALQGAGVTHIYSYDSPEHAVTYLYATHQVGDEWLVTGSFYTVATVRRLVEVI